MTDLELFHRLNDRIYQIYVEQGLTSLRGIDPDDMKWFKFEGVDLHRKFYDAVKPEVAFDSFAIMDDLIELSDQIMYYTGQLYLVTNSINNPVHHGVQPDGWDHPIYCNYQNLSAKRYNNYADTVAEKFYAYWNRLATLLNYYLPEPMELNAVNFPKVIQKLKAQFPQFHHNAGYIWLQAFKGNEQRALNTERNTIVHHVTTSTKFMEQHRENAHDREALEAIMEERLSRPDFYRNHITLSLRALGAALDLIAEIDPVVTEPVAPVIEAAA